MWLSSSFLQCFPPMEEKTYFLSFQFFSDNPVWQMFSHGQIFSCNVFPPWMENIFSFYSCRALSQSYVAKYTKNMHYTDIIWHTSTLLFSALRIWITCHSLPLKNEKWTGQVKVVFCVVFLLLLAGQMIRICPDPHLWVDLSLASNHNTKRVPLVLFLDTDSNIRIKGESIGK